MKKPARQPLPPPVFPDEPVERYPGALIMRVPMTPTYGETVRRLRVPHVDLIVQINHTGHPVGKATIRTDSAVAPGGLTHEDEVWWFEPGRGGVIEIRADIVVFKTVAGLTPSVRLLYVTPGNDLDPFHELTALGVVDGENVDPDIVMLWPKGRPRGFQRPVLKELLSEELRKPEGDGIRWK